MTYHDLTPQSSASQRRRIYEGWLCLLPVHLVTIGFRPSISASDLVEDGWTYLKQSTLDFECPRGYSLPCLKVDRLNTLRRCSGLACLPQLPWNSMTKKYTQSSRSLIRVSSNCSEEDKDTTTVGVFDNASWTSAFFLDIVQSSFRSISKRSWYIFESAANSGCWRTAFGIFLSVSLRFLEDVSVR